MKGLTNNEKVDVALDLLKANEINLKTSSHLLKNMKQKSRNYDVFVTYKGWNGSVGPTFKATSVEDAIQKSAAKIEKIVAKRPKDCKKFEVIVGVTFSEKAFRELTKKRRRSKRAGKKG